MIFQQGERLEKWVIENAVWYSGRRTGRTLDWVLFELPVEDSRDPRSAFEFAVRLWNGR